MTPRLSGSAPPDRLVPAPRATTGTPAAWQRRSTSTSWASLSGIATAAGSSRYIVRPSHSYGLVSSAVVSSADAGRTDASWAWMAGSSMDGWRSARRGAGSATDYSISAARPCGGAPPAGEMAALRGTAIQSAAGSLESALRAPLATGRAPPQPKPETPMRISRLLWHAHPGLRRRAGAARRTRRRADHAEDEHLHQPELALRRRGRRVRARGRGAHRRPLQGAELLFRRARRRARVDRGAAGRHARPHDDLHRSGAEFRARGRDPRHPVPDARLRRMRARCSTARSARTCSASSRRRASWRSPGARTASGT